jgi:hypothetical protein
MKIETILLDNYLLGQPFYVHYTKVFGVTEIKRLPYLIVGGITLEDKLRQSLIIVEEGSELPYVKDQLVEYLGTYPKYFSDLPGKALHVFTITPIRK